MTASVLGNTAESHKNETELEATLRIKRSILSTGVSCIVCKVGVNLLQRHINSGLSDETIMGTIKPVCMLQFSEGVCDGVNQIFAVSFRDL